MSLTDLEKEIVDAIVGTVVDAVAHALQTGRGSDALEAAKSRARYEAHRIAFLHAADAITRAAPRAKP